ncbi:Alpha-D-ribose 1-methylphosphonate 5-triphosphate synthase subunit PhnL [Jeotgalicoccus aerolatus]|uniref:Alpha-D-ribose 1-methylphosphonate 5-triphosphate synthase subunit PhnL n=2 Tax=Jeotgalicoccus aerolatus TaxID=709510 RepID=A0ABS4HPM7_9STAP|nr:ATP-binding cassette domain-containing protein [Jeotgalicoccus aerolatus]MBP1952880.1 alpha-D-ribose 1-methylphosphonate 5-triphosphate synthase subunit PhnL [Jeotgalicoccus aerolatus]GGE07272.1 ABC transporter [Jeotgalicoccus aerolatus]CAD2080360.1 Alpha-D-ribose 1-methylphosphonate 5-triphosphate synthase subunit PhnL [Jeotgalicoccus aerolatus]
MIKINDFSKSFTIHHLNQTREAVSGVTFDVKKGEFLGIVGESGSGKSTILKSIYGTYKPTTGAVTYASESFGDVDLHSITDRALIQLRTKEIGYVSQFLKVMPRTTTLELVINSMLEMGIDKDTAAVKAKETLRHFDIPEALWHNYPNTFSGGEKLRLNIACAVVKNPRLLLLDEPTASLDEKSKLKVRETISKLIDNGTTLIGIFHDLEFMDGLCTKVYDMNTKSLEERAV